MGERMSDTYEAAVEIGEVIREVALSATIDGDEPLGECVRRSRKEDTAMTATSKGRAGVAMSRPEAAYGPESALERTSAAEDLWRPSHWRKTRQRTAQR